MAAGGPDLALVVGGEALATLRHHPGPAWSHSPDEPVPFPLTLDRHEAANGIYQAYLTFALLDTARRTHQGRSSADYRREPRPAARPPVGGGRRPARARMVPGGP